MKYSDQQRVQRIYDNDIFDEEQIMKSFARSERHDEARENAKRLIKRGKLPLDEIAICLPSISMRELKELEAEISAESMTES